MTLFELSAYDRKRRFTRQPEKSRQGDRPEPKPSQKKRSQRPGKGPDPRSGPLLIGAGVRRADDEGMTKR